MATASVERPLETHEVNVTGTLNMLLASRQAGCKRLVMAASSAAYGENPASLICVTVKGDSCRSRGRMMRAE